MILQKDILDKLAKERASRDTEEGKKFTEKHKSQIASFQYFLINGEQMPNHAYTNLNQLAEFNDGGYTTLIEETIKECMGKPHLTRRALAKAIGSKPSTVQTYIQVIKRSLADLGDGVIHIPPQFSHLIKDQSPLEQEYESDESPSNTYISKEKAIELAEELANNVREEMEGKMGEKIQELTHIFESKLKVLESSYQTKLQQSQYQLTNYRLSPLPPVTNIGMKAMPLVIPQNSMVCPQNVIRFVGLVNRRNKPTFSRILAFMAMKTAKCNQKTQINFCGMHTHPGRTGTKITEQLFKLIVRGYINHDDVTPYECKMTCKMELKTFKNYVSTYGEILDFLFSTADKGGTLVIELYNEYVDEVLKQSY
jgi:hypothetical protein